MTTSRPRCAFRSLLAAFALLATAACEPEPSDDASSPAPAADDVAVSSHEEAAVEGDAHPVDVPVRAPLLLAPDADVAAPARDPFGGVPVHRDAPFRGTAVDFELAALAESEPSGLAVDGRIDEWTAVPDGALPAAAGQGRIWIAFTEAAFVVAGEVDARVDGIALDKVRVDLALAPPVLPPIAFMSQMSSAIVDEAWCHSTAFEGPIFGAEKEPVTSEAEGACRRWLSRCQDLRASIAQRFVRTLIVDLAKGTVSGAPGVRGAVVKTTPGASGASFELRLPSASFPETSEMPLRTVQVAVRAFSDSARAPSDAGATPPVSSEPSRKVFTRAAELRLHRAPEIVERIVLHANAQDARPLNRVAVSYIPSPTSARVHYFYNQGSGGQWAPSIPSPRSADLDVAASRRLFTLPACSADGGDEPCAQGGDIDLVAHTVWIDERDGGAWHPYVALVSRRGREILEVSPFTSYDPYTLVKRAPGVHVLNVFQGPSDSYGSGYNCLVPAYAFEVWAVDGLGHFTQVEGPQPADAERPATGFDLCIHRDYLIVGSSELPGFEVQAPAAGGLWIDPTLKFFGLRGEFHDYGEDAAAGDRSFEVGYRWDASSRSYVLFGRTPVPAGAGSRKIKPD